MKKVSLLLAALVFAASAFAQNGTKTETRTTADGTSVKKKTMTYANGTTKTSASATTHKQAHPGAKTTTTHSATTKEN